MILQLLSLKCLQIVFYIVPADKYQYDKYATSRQFSLAVTKTISTVANVSIIRVNGFRVRALDCVAIVICLLLLT